MARDWFDDYGSPEYRRATVARELARLNLASPSEDPAVLARKQRETAARLAAHDAMFLDMSPEAVAQRLGYESNMQKVHISRERPRFTAGDDDSGSD